MDERTEALIDKIVKGESIEDFVPLSRQEQYLKTALMRKSAEDLPNPQSRLDVLLYGMASGYHMPSQEKTVTPSVEAQEITPDEGYYKLDKVAVEAVTSDIDENIKPENILQGVSILGVDGVDKGYDTGCSDSNAEFSKFLEDKIGTFRIPDGTTILKAYAMSGGWYLNIVYVPDSVIKLNNNAFANGYNLTKVIFEGGRLTTIGTYIFQSDNKLKTVEFGCELATDMANDMFNGCSSLETVTFAQEELYRNICLHPTSKLKKECAYAAIRKLRNYIGTDKEYTYNFKLHATVWANVDDTTAEGYEAPPSGDTWKDYVASLGYNI